MILTLTPNAVGARDLTQVDKPLELWFADYKHRIGDKDGSAFVPAVFKENHRTAANVTHMTALVIDGDHLTRAAYDDLATRVLALKCKFWFYETHQHSPEKDDCRARVVIPFAEPIAIENNDHWKLIRAKLLDAMSLTKFADPATADCGRFYYFPSKPSEADERNNLIVHPEGQLLDAKPFHVPFVVKEKPKVEVPKQEPQARTKTTFDFEPLLKALRDPGAGKSKTLRLRLANGEALVEARAKGRPGGAPSRNEAWLRVIGSLTMLKQFDLSVESEVYLEGLLRPSWSAEVAEAEAAGEEPTAWEKVVDLFERSRATAETKRTEYEAKRAAEEAYKREILEGLGVAPKSEHKEAPKPGDPDAWQVLIDWKVNKDGERSMSNDPRNLFTVLRYDPQWAGKIRANAISQNIELDKCPINDGEMRLLRDADTVAVCNWMHFHWGVRINNTDGWNQILLVAEHNRYDPARERADALQWDGVDRLTTAGIDLLHAIGTDEEKIHACTAFKRLMIARQARIFEPGCQSDSMLVLQSPQQGKRKSTLCKILGGEYFSDEVIDVHSKDTSIAAGRKLVVEFGELAGTNRRDRNSLLAFISRRVDQVRPPYGRAEVMLPRRCIFIGTTNEDAFMVDIAGSRRFWIVSIGSEPIDTAAIEAQLDQLDAQAIALYKSGEQWWLTDEEAQRSERIATKFAPNNMIADKIERSIKVLEPATRPRVISLADAAVMASLENEKGIDRQDKLVRAVQWLGFERKGSRWVTPDYLLNEPRLTAAEERAKSNWSGDAEAKRT